MPNGTIFSFNTIMHGIQIQTLEYLEQQWKIQVNQLQLQNMGPAYFIDIHFCSVYYPKQTQGNSHSEIYTYTGGGGGGDFKYAKKSLIK